MKLDGLPTFCAALVAVTLGASAVLAEQARASVATVLDSNWRGSYDLLVTVPDGSVTGVTTAGLTDGNFVANAGSGGITVQQLAEIRQIPSVDLAAPIGLVGQLRTTGVSPFLGLVDDPEAGVSALDGPTLIRATVDVQYHDALGTSQIARSQGVVYARPQPARDADDRPAEPWFNSTTNDFGPLGSDKSLLIPLGQLPALPSAVVAVDPEAEQQLLGGASFLDPLVRAPAQRTIPEAAPVFESLVDPRLHLTQQSALTFAGDFPERFGQPVVPLMVRSPDSVAAQSVTVSVLLERATESAPGTTPSDISSMQALAQNATFEEWQRLEIDASEVLAPFAAPELMFTLPGQPVPEGGVFAQPASDLSPVLVGRPDYTSSPGSDINEVAAPPMSEADGDRPGFVVQPRGPVHADGLDNVVEGSGAVSGVGLVQSYRAATVTTGTGTANTFPAPVGRFTAEDIQVDSDAISYVPFGAYDPATTTLLQPATSDARAGSDLTANLSGLDYITATPGAFTDLAGGQALRGSTPIDAVRVRVAGITGYTELGQNRVLEVARQIDDLGLHVTLVAGSSQQPVNVFVPDHDPGSSDDLGWVRQDWTTLGAAVTVGSATTSLQLGLAGLASGAAALSALTTSVGSGLRSRGEVAALRQIGWRDRRIRRQLMGRQAAVLALAVLAPVLTLALAGTSAPVLVASGVAGVLLLSAAATTIATAVRDARQSQAGRTNARPVATTTHLAFRRLASEPRATTAQAAGLVVLGVAVVTISAALEVATRSAGATRLATAALDATNAASLLLAAVGLSAALILVITGRRQAVNNQAREHRTLAVIGLRSRTLRQIDRTEYLLLALPAITLAALAGAAAASLAQTSPAVVALAVVIVTATAALTATIIRPSKIMRPTT